MPGGRTRLRLPWFVRARPRQLPYLMRRLLPERFRFPCWVQSPSRAWHFVSADPADDWVLDDMLGGFTDLYFPALADGTVGALDRGGVLLDVGAFNGSWTAEMLRRHPHARAIAVEPSPIKIAEVRRTLQDCGRLQQCRIVEAALAPSSGQGWLRRSDTGSWGDWLARPDETPPPDGIPIGTAALDAMLMGAAPVVAKCNAEGAEYTFVRQLSELGLRPDLLILMVHPEHGDVHDLRQRLIELGYGIHIALDHPTRPCWHARVPEPSGAIPAAPEACEGGPPP